MKLEITIRDKYSPAMEITDQAEADRYWNECVEHNMRCQKAEGAKADRAKAERVEKQNLGFYAGYYGHETRTRVERLFRCAHPIFGKVITALVRCRDCKHWKTPTPQYGETYDRNQPPDAGWWDGVCRRLQYGITINASGGWDGATVDSVETDANFACIYGETP